MQHNQRAAASHFSSEQSNSSAEAVVHVTVCKLHSTCQIVHLCRKKIPKVSPNVWFAAAQRKSAARPPSIHSSWCCSSWGKRHEALSERKQTPFAEDNAAAIWLEADSIESFIAPLKNELVLWGALMWTCRFSTGGGSCDRQQSHGNTAQKWSRRNAPLFWRSADD